MKTPETKCPLTRQPCMNDCEMLNTMAECMLFEGMDALIRIAQSLEERNEADHE